MIKTFRVAGKEDDNLSFDILSGERGLITYTLLEDDKYKFFIRNKGKKEREVDEDTFLSEWMEMVVLREFNEYGLKPPIKTLG